MRKLLSIKNIPTLMVMMLQQEVAKRIIASDSKESILSISIKIYGTPKYIKTVSKKYFKPKPKVDSAITLIDNISKKKFDKLNEQKFFEVLRLGFSHKRKLLSNNLQNVYSKEVVQKTFEVCNIKTKTRAENMDSEDWRCVSLSLK